MSKRYRYRFPPFLYKCICVLEKAIVPILLFQLIRTVIWTTTLDLVLLCFIIIIFILFYVEFI